MPLKVEVTRHLDELDVSAKMVGAVNTILNKDGTLIGYNTDGEGALMALRESNENPADKKIVIIGAGGASRAISWSLTREAKEIVILNRTRIKAEKLAHELSMRFGDKVRYGELHAENLRPELKDADLLINATSLGMRPYEQITPVHKDFLRSDLAVFDLVYDPLETRLLNDARSLGANTIQGLTMLIYQGAASFTIWTKKKAPIDIMMEAARNHLAANRGK
jgi:shikimate dehydrogenase